MRNLLFLLLLTTILHGCKRQNSSESVAVDVVADTVAYLDTIAEGEELDTLPRPATADGIFRDFFYDFTNNKRFQKQRISFPLKVKEKQINKLINKQEWKFQSLLSDTSIYTAIFTTEQAMALENDHALKHVVVDNIHLNDQTSTSWHFSKKMDMWMLDSIETMEITEHKNGDFIEFYRMFATHEAYQAEHIAHTLIFKTYDAETSSDIEGYIEGQQWQAYAPILPNDAFVNFRYEQNVEHANHRVLMIANPNENQISLLYFRRHSSIGWMLYKFEI